MGSSALEKGAPPSLVRSRQRVADHGEVFTPPNLVEAMIGLVAAEAERIDSRILEPACGSGNFLVPVLRRKLATVDARYGKSEFERRHHVLLALMSIYGIELLADNVAECRQNLLEVFVTHLGSSADDEWTRAAARVLAVNIVHGDALTMQTRTSPLGPITFAEWVYLGKGRYHRRDFRLDTLTQMSSFGEEDTLFADLGKHEVFTPMKDHGTLSVTDVARAGAEGSAS
ncbi:N-6 DNA methylase [Georgenia sp.]